MVHTIALFLVRSMMFTWILGWLAGKMLGIRRPGLISFALSLVYLGGIFCWGGEKYQRLSWGKRVFIRICWPGFFLWDLAQEMRAPSAPKERVIPNPQPWN